MITSNHGAVPPGLKLVMLLAAVFGMASALGASYGMERVWERRFSLPPGGQVTVENVHGNIWVEGWDRAEVEASVVMRSPRPTDRLDDVQVAVEARSGSLAFHTLYPGDLDAPVLVDYHLRVPRQVRLEQLSTLAGGIAVRDVEGAVQARSLRGDIEEVNVAGSVVARALTGNIWVSLRALPAPQSPVRLETLNGNLDLLLPPQANADLELSTVAGRILGTYTWQASSVPGDSTRRTRLGRGGVRVELRTVRGNIRVDQRDEDL
jgi:hypothetical protein